MISVLFICHGHPDYRPGGAEIYSWELFLETLDCPRLNTHYLARVDVFDQRPRLRQHPSHANCFLLESDPRNYDHFAHELHDITVYHELIGPLVRKLSPGVIHFQHTFGLGYQLIEQVKKWLPEAKIVYTLHEYLPICYNAGQLFRTQERVPCDEASPQRCHECYPDLSPWSFHLRYRHLLELLKQVDLLIAPSHFLREKFVKWGIEPNKIRYEEYGRRFFDKVEHQPDSQNRIRLAYFGQINYFKGLHVLLQAIKLLDTYDRSRLNIKIYGANLHLQSQNYQNAFTQTLSELCDVVQFMGAYQLKEIGKHLSAVDWVIVPSIWWENSPLVIQEAFHWKIPVLTSDIGGMAEKVRNEVNGLHFRAGEVKSLADTIHRVVNSPELRDKLQQGILPVYRMQDHLNRMINWYEE